MAHGLRTPREEIAFTAWPKIHSHSQFFRYGRSIFCLPRRLNFSDIFDLFLHWVSVVFGWSLVCAHALIAQMGSKLIEFESQFFTPTIFIIISYILMKVHIRISWVSITIKMRMQDYLSTFWVTLDRKKKLRKSKKGNKKMGCMQFTLALHSSLVSTMVSVSTVQPSLNQEFLCT